jgi:4-diphosphocytidyl-2-C-methyl-D-erythritol kinase
MRANAYAKINLTLEIIGKYMNGYHGIVSVFQQISLYDTITAEKTKEGKVIRFNHDIEEDNTVRKAVLLFEKEIGKEIDVLIDVEKRIPEQAGLGGGSSDAATTLRILNILFNYPLSEEKLQKIGMRIGADVPFFFIGHTALVEGKGEKVQPIAANLHYYVLICLPPFGISTKLAYELSDKYRLWDKGKRSHQIVSAIKRKKPIEAYLYNHFEKIYEKEESFAKFIDFKKNVENLTNKKFHLSGSGSAIFALFNNPMDAKKTAELLKEKQINVILSETV